jgi:hypothetical protein
VQSSRPETPQSIGRRTDRAVAARYRRSPSDLTTGLSRKVWQKLSILYAMGPEAPSAGPPASGA